MTNIGLHTGLKALLSARFVLDTIGHNIANANTPGYARQRVDLGASLPLKIRGLLIGSGVDAGAIERSVDELLDRRILLQRSVQGNLGLRLGGLSELESFLGDGQTTGLGGFLDGFFTSVSKLAAVPDDPILRSALVQSAEALTTRFHEGESFFARRAVDAQAEVRSRVEGINGRATEIATLNVEIGEAEGAGVSANDLRDRRDRLLGELAELVDVTTVAGPNGSVQVLVAGHTLVSSDRANRMSVVPDAIGPNGALQIQIEGAQGYVTVAGGSLRALLDLAHEYVPELRARFDELARELVLATNRVHSTGIPAAGAFSILAGENRVQDFDGDGQAVDELLSNAGLPFDVTSGALWVNVTDQTTGDIERHRIAISATHTTVQDFLDAVNDVPSLSADLDASGRVRIVADAGFAFDFSARLDSLPDAAGAFGGSRASLAALGSEPYALSDGDTLDLTADVGGTNVSFQIAFSQADFKEISQATAEEIAAVINADPLAQANGIVAASVAGTLVLQTLAEGANANFALDGGSAAAALGWSALVGNTITGQPNDVEARISGSYDGSAEERWIFRPRSDGTVGTTAGLMVDVFDSSGNPVTALDIGAGYVPGTELPVADGVMVSFGLGEISATHGDLFALDLVGDSDTSDVLVALGINGFFTGSNASDIEVRSDLLLDPSRVATLRGGAVGDGSLLLELLDVENAPAPGLDGVSPSEFYGAIVAELGFQLQSTTSALQASETVMQSLERRRDQVSGVDVDEELVDLVAFEQAFAAAAQYIQTINELDDELLSLL